MTDQVVEELSRLPALQAKKAVFLCCLLMFSEPWKHLDMLSRF